MERTRINRDNKISHNINNIKKSTRHGTSIAYNNGQMNETTNNKGAIMEFNYKIQFKDGTEYSDSEHYDGIDNLLECQQIMENSVDMDLVDYISLWID